MNEGPIPLIVVGGTGRMGRMVVARAGDDAAFALVAVVGAEPERPSWLPAAVAYAGNLAEVLGNQPRTGVVISVSAEEGESERVRGAAAAGWAYVEGTTALSEATMASLRAASARVPVVHAPNFSVGIALLRVLLARTAEALRGAGWDVALLDRHHRAKKDAPSGTAKLLAETMTGDATPLPIAAFRQGGVIGEHTVFATGPSEELVLVHRAFDRGAFADGALRAARFAFAAAPGWYGMDAVVGPARGEGEGA